MEGVILGRKENVFSPCVLFLGQGNPSFIPMGLGRVVRFPPPLSPEIAVQASHIEEGGTCEIILTFVTKPLLSWKKKKKWNIGSIGLISENKQVISDLLYCACTDSSSLLGRGDVGEIHCFLPIGEERGAK